MAEIKKRFISMPFKKAFILLIIVMALFVTGLSACVISLCSQVQKRLLNTVMVPVTSLISPQSEEDSEGIKSQADNIIIMDSNQVEKGEDGKLYITMIEPRYENMGEKHKLYYNIAECMRVAAPCILFVIGTFFCAWFFYNMKIKKPLALLLNGTELISQNELDFSMEYNASDEMGKLVVAMDTMRSALQKNNEEMWNMMDERRKLASSIAHDLRTPLTVLKGYNEYLSDNLPLGKISEKKLIQTVENMTYATERMESYVNQVRDLQTLDAVLVKTSDCNLNAYFGQHLNEYIILSESKGLNFKMLGVPELNVMLDKELFSRILDNIMSNAIRYAVKNISMEVLWQDDILSVSVCDDGAGFTETSLENAVKPFYKENSKNDHYGLGLSICDTLCRKMGGMLALRNTENKGACVFVTVRAEKSKLID